MAESQLQVESFGWGDALGAEGASWRIALVLASSTGGVGRHVRGLANGLSDAGCRVAVIGPAATQQRFGFARSRPATIRFAPAEIGSGFAPVEQLRAAVRLRRLTKQADIVHAHGFRAAVVAAAALGPLPFLPQLPRRGGAHRRPALVVTFHNELPGDLHASGARSTTWSGRRQAALRAVQAWLLASANAVLAVSPDLTDGLRPRRPDVERALVSSSLPPPRRSVEAVRRGLGLAEARPLVLAVGRLHQQKGFDVLIGAAALMRDASAGRPVADVLPLIVIAGEGPERADLEQAIAAAGVDVRLLGDRSDVADLVAAADVVVMPSRWEGWPLAAAEVLAAGRPLVASAVGGLPELAGDAAYLVEAGDPVALATALTEVLGEPGLAARLGVLAVTRAAHLPTDDDVTRSVLGTYRRVLAGTP